MAGIKGAGVSGGLADVQRQIAAHDYAGAERSLAPLLSAQPDDSDLLSLMTFVLMQQGRGTEAVEPARKAATVRPTAEATVTLAQAQLHAGDPAGALRTLDKALASWPGYGPAWACAIDVCMSEARYLAAAERGRKALARCPADLGLTMMTSLALESAGQITEAMEMCRGMVARYPTNAGLHGTIAYLSNYRTDLPREEVFDLHRKYGRVLARHRPVAARPGTVEDVSGRRLRVGFVSPDLREHSVAYFVAPVLRHYDRSRLEVFAYYTRRVGDAVTERLRGLVDHWRVSVRAHPEELAKTIAADTLDVLIDLAGHTAGDSLEALHLRPAARQATYLGYPNTTGLAAVDYRVVDGHTDPTGAESFCTERLVRLSPCFLCFEPPEAPQGGAPVPADAPITFCSFNARRKVNDPLIALWARVLGATPGSRLLLKCNGLGEAAMCEALRTRFASHGIGAERLDLRGPVKPLAAHLAAYADAHIGLDTFPYHGTTTTCEAMWMGVPVVTLEGDRHVSRVGASLLSTVGLTDLIARTQDEYVRCAASLAADRGRLNELRASLRGRMASSPLCDGPSFCRRFEAALQAMTGAPR